MLTDVNGAPLVFQDSVNVVLLIVPVLGVKDRLGALYAGGGGGGGGGGGAAVIEAESLSKTVVPCTSTAVSVLPG